MKNKFGTSAVIISFIPCLAILGASNDFIYSLTPILMLVSFFLVIGLSYFSFIKNENKVYPILALVIVFWPILYMVYLWIVLQNG